MARLSDDFPHVAELNAAGINTEAQLRKQIDSEDGLTAVKGIGDAKAEEIMAALNTTKSDAADTESSDKEDGGRDMKTTDVVAGQEVGLPDPREPIGPDANATPDQEEKRTAGERLANCGLVWVDEISPSQRQWAGEPERYTGDEGKRKVLPIAQSVPRRGTEVRAYGEVYTVQDEFDKPEDWLKVQSPSGRPLIP